MGLYFSYLNKKIKFIEFIKKRWTKIYIPYIIVVFISFLCHWMYLGNDRLSAFISHIFLYKMFIPKYEESFGIQFWFISTIIQFYLLFIPMCKLKEKIDNNKLFLSMGLLISVFWWIICYVLNVSDIRVWNSFCLQYIWEFSFGMVLADEFKKGKIYKIYILQLFFVAVVGLGLQAGLAMYLDKFKLFNDIPALFGYSALSLLLMNIKLIKKVCVIISKFSYELFLIHILVFKTVFQIIQFNSLTMQIIEALIAFILSLICAFIYNRLINNSLFKY
jgi:peptidoglycan/LPS O-acetylase OafA/YrhL